MLIKFVVRKLDHTVQRRPGAHEPNERTRSNQEHLPLTHKINSYESVQFHVDTPSTAFTSTD